MDRDTIIHDLTMLYLKNSIDLSNSKEASEYAQKYYEASNLIESKLKELKKNHVHVRNI